LPVNLLRVKFFAVLAVFALCLPAQADPLRVAAAANLQKVFTDALLPAFTKKTGVQVLPTYGATKLLATQIENGAPLDVFVAADTATPTKLLAEKLLAFGTVQPYAVGRLVVWSRKDAGHHPQTLQDLASPLYAKIAYANPKTAPYGLAAEQSLAKAGLSASVAPRLVQAENIGQALQFAGAIEYAEFAAAQAAGAIEARFDYYGDFRWAARQIAGKRAQLEALNAASVKALLDIVRQAQAADCGLVAFGD